MADVVRAAKRKYHVLEQNDFAVVADGPPIIALVDQGLFEGPNAAIAIESYIESLPKPEQEIANKHSFVGVADSAWNEAKAVTETVTTTKVTIKKAKRPRKAAPTTSNA